MLFAALSLRRRLLAYISRAVGLGVTQIVMRVGKGPKERFRPGSHTLVKVPGTECTANGRHAAHKRRSSEKQ